MRALARDTFAAAMVLAAMVAAALCVRCAPARTAYEAEACRNTADRAAVIRARAECPPGPFRECPNYEAIMGEWESAVKACR